MWKEGCLDWKAASEVYWGRQWEGVVGLQGQTKWLSGVERGMR